ncbi:Possible purine/pyrimidine phosphoribosyltransferase [hydrothermal vent metagenome]|uniref:Possible purine/pyrimidine phosphoribosyltransferase n=1 Tax=hydrothermal vent metagenome TaxID=652676 RepID=A0A1W1BYT7_9ZZZZ
MICKKISFLHICKSCQKEHLQPSLIRRKLYGKLEVLSFYPYTQIKELLHTKHTDLGYHIYTILAQNSFAKFAKEFSYPNEVAIIGIDEKPKGLYSHTAILTKHCRSQSLKPYHAKLIAKNELSYSGKSKSFRLQNPRNFTLKDFPQKECILMDDIITTGITLSEAVTTLARADKEILFCLALADARD